MEPLRDRVTMEVQRAMLMEGDAYTIAKESTDAIMQAMEEERAKEHTICKAIEIRSKANFERAEKAEAREAALNVKLKEADEIMLVITTDSSNRLVAASIREAELLEHERQTHDTLGAILGTDTSLEDAARRLKAREATLVEALVGCVEAIDHMAHGVRDKDAEGNILAAARAALAVKEEK